MCMYCSGSNMSLQSKSILFSRQTRAVGSQDLANIRLFAAFLTKTEIKFDMVSAVDELAAQIKLEFDFEREARVMDSISRHLQVSNHCLLRIWGLSISLP